MIYMQIHLWQNHTFLHLKALQSGNHISHLKFLYSHSIYPCVLTFILYSTSRQLISVLFLSYRCLRGKEIQRKWLSWLILWKQNGQLPNKWKESKRRRISRREIFCSNFFLSNLSKFQNKVEFLNIMDAIYLGRMK